MGRIKKTVFISYRRTNLPWALAIFQNLKNEGYDVFFDYLSIPSGDFENIIVENIKGRAHFVVILTPSALERCNEPGDWLRREIETAMDEKRNIIPLMLESFDFGSPYTVKALTGKLEKLKKYNGLRLHSEYFFEGMNRLREQYLNVSLDAVVHPISESAKPVTEEHQIAAGEADAVEKEQLTAQEWFEQGYKFDKDGNVDEAIRCFTEAIKLQTDFAGAYLFRGLVRKDKGDFEGAKVDFNETIRLKTKAIDLNPEDIEAYNNRGVAYFFKDDLDRAIQDYSNAIRCRPDSAPDFVNRANAYKKKGDYDSAFADFKEAIRLRPEDAMSYAGRASIRNDKGDIDGAIEDYSKAINLKPELASLYIGRGNALRAKHELDNALTDYNNAIQMKPDYAEAYHGRGLARKEFGDLKGAISDYTEAIRIKPDYVNAYWGRGNAFWAIGDYSSAAIDYQQYYDLGGSNENLRYYLNEARKRTTSEN